MEICTSQASYTKNNRCQNHMWGLTFGANTITKLYQRYAAFVFSSYSRDETANSEQENAENIHKE